MNIQTLRLGPDDVLVVSVPGAISDAMGAEIKARIHAQIPGVKVLVLSTNITLTVVQKAA